MKRKWWDVGSPVTNPLCAKCKLHCKQPAYAKMYRCPQFVAKPDEPPANKPGGAHERPVGARSSGGAYDGEGEK